MKVTNGLKMHLRGEREIQSPIRVINLIDAGFATENEDRKSVSKGVQLLMELL